LHTNTVIEHFGACTGTSSHGIVRDVQVRIINGSSIISTDLAGRVNGCHKFTDVAVDETHNDTGKHTNQEHAKDTGAKHIGAFTFDERTVFEFLVYMEIFTLVVTIVKLS